MAQVEGTPLLNIVGTLVALGPLRRDLVPLYTRWMNDFQVIRGTGSRLGPMTDDAELAWYEGASKPAGREPNFTIYEKATLRPIGTTGFHEVDLIRQTASWGIMIGEKDCWGKGYGTETARLMLDYGFTALGLHNIMLQVYSFNERGYHAYLRAGYKEIGRRRESFPLAGRRYDTILMDCLAREFEGSVVADLLRDNPS